MSAFFSVVIPLFDKAPTIRRTVESVLRQTHPPLELLVVDDGSTDGGPAQLSDLADRGVRLIVQANAGPGPARNRGIAEAQGEWIAFLDGDDLWRPDHLATLADLAAAFPDCAMVATSFSQHRLGEPVDEQIPCTPVGPPTRYDPLADHRGMVPLWTGAVAVRRDALAALGGFGAFVPGEDVELWLRLALGHRIALSPRRTALYFRGTGGLMDAIERQCDAPRMHPISATIDGALADPGHRARHAGLRAFRDRRFRGDLKSLLYRGEPAIARWLAREADRPVRAKLGPWRALLALPDPLLRLLARTWRAGRG